jgi:GNAT superfamily N-acetyltransferase
MADLDVLGIYREERFSPGRVEDDRAILDVVSDELRRQGVGVRMLDAERLPTLDGPPSLIFAMCQGDEALSWLDDAARRTVVVNHPDSIRACYRVNLVERLAALGVPQPRWVFAGDGFPTGLGAGPWLKRGDVHAMEAGDVVRVFTAEEWDAIMARFRGRGIARAIVQKHVEGLVYKFYGVRGGFFRAYGLPAEREAEAASLAERGALALELEVYGGDGVCALDGKLSLIDFNDWPSFARCRRDAGAAIARRLADLVKRRSS